MCALCAVPYGLIISQNGQFVNRLETILPFAQKSEQLAIIFVQFAERARPRALVS